MKSKIEVKEEVDEDTDSKMEVLRLLKANPKLHPVSQEAPVDLTTTGKMCPTSILQQMTYPHLRFYSKDSQKQEVESYIQSFTEKSRSSDVKDFKENKFSESLKKEAKPLLETNHNSKKRRMQEEYPDLKCQSLKRQRTESSNKTGTYSAEVPLKRDAKLQETTDSTYFNQQYLPYLYYDHSTLLEKIKTTDLANVSASSLKETESLLAAVQHSQMLYYSYCSKLFQNLQTRRYNEEQEIDYNQLGNFSSSKNGRDLKKPHLAISEAKKSLKPTSKLKTNHSQNAKNILPEETSSSQGCSHQKSFAPSYSYSPANQSQVYVRSSLTYSSPSLPDTLNEQELDLSPSNEESKGIIGRKRAPRALTGKHVRQGTGASPTTLLTLRQKLEERQRVRRAQSISADEENTSVED